MTKIRWIQLTWFFLIKDIYRPSTYNPIVDLFSVAIRFLAVIVLVTYWHVSIETYPCKNNIFFVSINNKDNYNLLFDANFCLFIYDLKLIFYL